MAKGIRVVTASADMAAIIDRGADVDIELKNLGFEDEGLKKKIREAATSSMMEGETTLRLEGEKAAAVVSASEKMQVRAAAEQFDELKGVVKKGLLEGVVTSKQELVVPPADIERAVEALNQAGIGASIVESLSVKAADVRSMRESEAESSEHVNARKALEACLVSTVSYRVKYEKE